MMGENQGGCSTNMAEDGLPYKRLPEEWTLRRPTPPEERERREQEEREKAAKAKEPLSREMEALLRGKDDDDIFGEDPEKIIKVAVVGDGTCGKTSLCTRFAQRDYGGRYNQTVGIDFFSRRIALSNRYNVLYQIWDIGGQSISASMLGKYIYDANCILFVYDVTNSTSFESITDWVAVVKRLLKEQDNEPTNLCLLGNKTDMEHRRTVRIDKHTRFADQNGMSSHYTSAKTGDSVDLTFKLIAAEVLGVQLTKTDVELAINAIEAPVAVVDPPKKEEAKPKQLPQIKPTIVQRDAEGNIDTGKDYTKQSGVCSIQ